MALKAAVEPILMSPIEQGMTLHSPIDRRGKASVLLTWGEEK